MAQVISVPFDEGGSILVEVAPDGQEVPFGRDPAQALAHKVRTLQSAFAPIRQVAHAFREEFDRLPDRPAVVTVRFGVQLNADGNAVVARAGIGANFDVTLEWHGENPSGGAGPDQGAGSAAPGSAPAAAPIAPSA